MDPLDIVLVFREGALASGGLSIDVRQTANSLADRGHRVTLATVAPPGSVGGKANSFCDAVEVRAFEPLHPQQTAFAFGLAYGMGRLVLERPKAIVHVISCTPAYLHLAAMAAAWRGRRPLVWTPMMHPLRRRIWGQYGAVGVAMRAFDATVPRLCRFVDAVVASTHAEAADFRRLGAARVEIVPPAVVAQDAASAADALEFRQRFGIAPSAPLVTTTTARADRRKGMPFALEAFRRVRERLPDATLLLIGLPAGGVPPEPGIIVPGKVTDSDLSRAYRASQVVFVASRYEAFSRVVIEAWQQVRPVVVTDGVGLAERVIDGGGAVIPYGDVCAACDALVGLMTDRTCAARQGSFGRSIVERNYELTTVVSQLESLYASVRRD